MFDPKRSLTLQTLFGLCVISGPRLGVNGIFYDILQGRFVFRYRRFGTTYRSHIQGPRSPRKILLGVLDYHSTVRNVSEGRGGLCSKPDVSSQIPYIPVYNVQDTKTSLELEWPDRLDSKRKVSRFNNNLEGSRLRGRSKNRCLELCTKKYVTKCKIKTWKERSKTELTGSSPLTH